MSALDSLAARLGMRRSPSGLDTTGALTQPPQAATWEWPTREVIPPGRAPDPLMFGPQCTVPGVQLPVAHCRACGCGWAAYAGAVCWYCGEEER